MEVRVYIDSDNLCPFSNWIDCIKDECTLQKIMSRVNRLESGNFGKCKSVGEGVFELKIDYGPGYRIYYGRYGFQSVILLAGGDKKTQNEDIKKAKEYWTIFRREKKSAHNPL